MINWLKGSTKTQKSDLKNLPEVNMAEWMTSGESAEFSKLLQTPLLRMAIRIVAESMPVPMPSHGAKESDIISLPV